MTKSSKLSSKINSKINSNISKFSSYKYKNVIITTLIIILIFILYLIISIFFVDNKKDPFDALNINNTYYSILNPPENMRQVSTHYDTTHPNCKIIPGVFPRGKPEKGYYEDNKNNCYGPAGDHLSSMLDTPQGWSAPNNTAIDNNLEKEWVEMNLGSVMSVAGVVTQSRGNGLPGAGNASNQMVSEYQVQWSTDKNKWENVDNSKKFTGNTVSNKKVGNVFSIPVLAQYIRILPTKYISWTSLRAAVLIPNSVTIKINDTKTLYPITNSVINVNNTMYTIVNPQDNPTSRQMSSSFSNSSLYNHIPSMLDSPQGWSAATNDKEWLQLNLDSNTAIAGVITQSRGIGFPSAGDYSTQMVTHYQVQYWNGTNWIYVDNSREFIGNSPVDDKIGNLFTNLIMSKSIRILPTKAINHTSMRAGLLVVPGEASIGNGVVTVVKTPLP